MNMKPRGAVREHSYLVIHDLDVRELLQNDLVVRLNHISEKLRREIK